jgi:hypothetical protein
VSFVHERTSRSRRFRVMLTGVANNRVVDRSSTRVAARCFRERCLPGSMRPSRRQVGRCR